MDPGKVELVGQLCGVTAIAVFFQHILVQLKDLLPCRWFCETVLVGPPQQLGAIVVKPLIADPVQILILPHGIWLNETLAM